MKNFLPTLFIFLVIFFGVTIISSRAFAAPPAPSATPIPTATPTPPASAPGAAVGQAAPDGSWVPNEEVTFAGKMASRADAFLTWPFENYPWIHIIGTLATAPPPVNPLSSFWSTISKIVYAFLALFILVAAFMIIISRGKNIKLMQFIPRFILVFVFIFLSFALVQFVYQIGDIVQGFFLKNAQGSRLTAHDLLSIAFNYKDFLGYRKAGIQFDEPVFFSLLLVFLRLTMRCQEN